MNPNVKSPFPKLNRKVSALELKTQDGHVSSKVSALELKKNRMVMYEQQMYFACLAYGLSNRRVGAHWILKTQDGDVSSKVSALEFKNAGWTCEQQSEIGALEFKVYTALRQHVHTHYWI